MHVEDPDVLVYSPSEHSSHPEARDPEYLPATHFVQLDEPLLLHVPASQSVHEALPSSLYVPASHGLHDARPVTELYVPLGHASHEVDPVLFW